MITWKEKYLVPNIDKTHVVDGMKILYVNKDLGLKDRIYKYLSCQFVINRDYNAAINIKKEGLHLLNKNL